MSDELIIHARTVDGGPADCRLTVDGFELPLRFDELSVDTTTGTTRVKATLWLDVTKMNVKMAIK